MAETLTMDYYREHGLDVSPLKLYYCPSIFKFLLVKNKILELTNHLKIDWLKYGSIYFCMVPESIRVLEFCDNILELSTVPCKPACWST